jgi:hypothetical protein
MSMKFTLSIIALVALALGLSLSLAASKATDQPIQVARCSMSSIKLCSTGVVVPSCCPKPKDQGLVTDQPELLAQK